MSITREDYEEPCCPLKMNQSLSPIPVRRILEKLDEALNRNDMAEAERLLRYWAAEAEAGNDADGLMTVLNEEIGLYRKLNRRIEGLEAVDTALSLAGQIGLRGVSLATTQINAATAYAAFMLPGHALPLYQQARASYEMLLEENDSRLAALYNNMALTLLSLGKFQESAELFGRAMNIMEKQAQGECDLAITCCNLADLYCAQFGENAGEIGEWLHRAQNYLDTPELERNGYYAYVCEKCAPVFGRYGYPLTEKTLMKRAKMIYEGT